MPSSLWAILSRPCAPSYAVKAEFPAQASGGEGWSRRRALTVKTTWGVLTVVLTLTTTWGVFTVKMRRCLDSQDDAGVLTVKTRRGSRRDVGCLDRQDATRGVFTVKTRRDVGVLTVKTTRGVLTVKTTSVKTCGVLTVKTWGVLTVKTFASPCGKLCILVANFWMEGRVLLFPGFKVSDNAFGQA
eukprot:1380837-Amorphochlora_amoeboformis.AAC.1